jgi:TonB-linked SusC/RagA family outer membrane protein
MSLILISGMSYAQKTVSGTVSGEDGPLAGASIIVKGTTTGTFSNIDGSYSVRMPEGTSVLVFKFSGYEPQEVEVSDPTVNVTLIPSTLDEVVVTAYGTQKKREITGSVATLNSEAIEKVQNSHVIQGLTGKIAGVQVITQNGQPGAAPSVRFRGIGSISGSNQPLYVVDGVPYNGNINAIATQDIESMTFLKDASANALYGSRGANGVIIITTKKAKANGLNITLDMKVGRNDRMAPDYDVITDPGQYYEAWYDRYRIGLINEGEDAATAAQISAAELIEGGDFSLGYNAYNVANDQLVDPATGRLNPSASLLYQDLWEDELFSPSARAETHLGISAKTDKTSTFFSLGYLDDSGFALQSGFDRITGRLSTDMQATNWLKVGANINYANTRQDAPLQNVASNTYSNLFSWARNVAPIYPVFGRDEMGAIINDDAGNPVYDFGTADDGIPGIRPYGAFNNPVATSILDIDQFTRDNLSSRVYATIDFLEEFSFTYNLSIDYVGSNITEFATPIGCDASNVNGRITTTASTALTVANQQLLNWNKTFDDHTFSVLLGHESNDWDFTSIEAQKTETLIPDIPVLDNAANIQYATGRELEYNVEGFFSRLGYDYKNKYFLNASFRRDGTSVFAPEVQWGTFYGVGAAWDLTQENFMKNIGFFNNLRIKASFGQQGNDALFYEDATLGRNYYLHLDQFDVVNAGGGVPGVSFRSLGNPDLRWEQSTNINAGFDTRFLNDRISLEMEYFVRQVEGLLFYNPLPLSEGRGSFPENVGDMTNNGLEITLGAEVVKTPNFTWGLNFNGTTFNNEITRLPQEFIDDGRFRLEEGRNRYEYFMREFAGINPENGESTWYMDELDMDGNVIGRTTTEEYNEATEYFVGKTAIPDLYGGFGTFLSWKGLSLDVNFAYQLGGYGYDLVYQNSLSSAPDVGQNFHKDVFNSWTPENTSATIPRIDLLDDQNTNTSDFWLVDASYLALQDITLSYDLPASVYSKIGLRGLRIYASGSNVALWSARQGYDPRLSVVGTASNEYSVMRSMSVGANVRF